MASGSWSWKRWLCFLNRGIVSNKTNGKKNKRETKKEEKKKFSFLNALGLGGPVRCCCFCVPLVTAIFRPLRLFHFVPCYSLSLIHKQAALYQVCPMCWIPTSILSCHELFKAGGPLRMWEVSWAFALEKPQIRGVVENMHIKSPPPLPHNLQVFMVT